MCEANIQTLASHMTLTNKRLMLCYQYSDTCCLSTQPKQKRGGGCKKKQNLYNILQSNTAPSQTTG